MTTSTGPRTDQVPMRPRGLSRGKQLAALSAMSLGGMGLGTAEFAAMGILPEVATGFEETVSATGAIVSAYALGVVLGAPVLTILGARMPRKALLAVLVGLLALGSVLSALAPSFTVLLVARFVTGLPHGAFFGVAAVVAADIVPPAKRGRAIAVVMSGITVAAIVAVPFATFLSQQFGWRAAFLVTVALSVVSIVLLLAYVPAIGSDKPVGIGAELRSVARWQVLATFAIVTLGFSGVFAVYSYIAPIVTEVTGFGEGGSLLMLALFGVGLALGNQLGGYFSERSQTGTVAGSFILIVVVLATFPIAMHHPVAVSIAVTLLGLGGFAMIAPLTARMLDSAGPAKSLAASLTQSGFNLANAIGAWSAGLVIATGAGWEAPAWLAVALTLVGVVVFVVAVVAARVSRRRA